MLDPDGYLNLVIGIARQWIRDARKDPNELEAFSEWIDLPRCEVERRLVNRESLFKPPRPGERACPHCGGSMAHRAKQARFCSDRCQSHAGIQRRKGAHATE